MNKDKFDSVVRQARNAVRYMESGEVAMAFNASPPLMELALAFVQLLDSKQPGV